MARFHLVDRRSFLAKLEAGCDAQTGRAIEVTAGVHGILARATENLVVWSTMRKNIQERNHTNVMFVVHLSKRVTLSKATKDHVQTRNHSSAMFVRNLLLTITLLFVTKEGIQEINHTNENCVGHLSPITII
ncbi:hypothetical protein BsWGS_23722 [Bradybaena similaris]